MRHDGPVVAGPGLLHQVCIGLGDLPLHAQRVAEVELLQVAVFEEVLGELWHIAEALQKAGPRKTRQRRGERGDQGGDTKEEAKRKETEAGGMRQGREGSSISRKGRTW